MISMKKELLKETMEAVYDHIMHDCTSESGPWRGEIANNNGWLLVDDEAGEVLSSVKEYLKYNELKALGKICELTVDNSWPLGNLDDCWRKFEHTLIATSGAKHGLLVVNINDIRVFAFCWCLKQLAKQETFDHIFNGHVILNVKGINWNDAEDYAHEYCDGEFQAMMTYYQWI